MRGNVCSFPPQNKHCWSEVVGQSTNSAGFFPSYLTPIQPTHLDPIDTSIGKSETQAAYFAPNPPKPCPLYPGHTSQTPSHVRPVVRGPCQVLCNLGRLAHQCIIIMQNIQLSALCEYIVAVYCNIIKW